MTVKILRFSKIPTGNRILKNCGCIFAYGVLDKGYCNNLTDQKAYDTPAPQHFVQGEKNLYLHSDQKLIIPSGKSATSGHFSITNQKQNVAKNIILLFQAFFIYVSFDILIICNWHFKYGHKNWLKTGNDFSKK